MASVKKAEIPKLAEFMSEFWIFIKQYYVVESDNDEYWEQLLNDARGLYEKYNSEPLAQGFVMEYIDYLDRRNKHVVLLQNKNG